MVDSEFDPAKNSKNIELRGLSCERAVAFDFATAWVVFTETAGGIRVISLRKANKREEKRYGQAQAQP